MKRRENGITLIALVVTIVVLLILAGVSISMLTGENGIIAQANNAKEATEQARVEELVDLAVESLISQNLGDTSKITPTDVAEEINRTEGRTDVYTDDETFPAIIKFLEEGREAVAELNSSITIGNSDEIYSVEVTEDMIAPVNIFDYEIIDDAEIGATEFDNLPTKEVKITRIKPQYANDGGYNPDTGNQEFQDTNYEIILEDGTKIDETLVIPYQVDGRYVEGGTPGEMYKITEVNAGVYWHNKYYETAKGYILPNVETIIYPNTVKIVEGNNYSTGVYPIGSDIKKIVLSQNLEIIGEKSFLGCYNLTDIVISEGVTSIGDEAFYGCSSLTNITIPESVIGIGQSTFRDCSSLTSITIPDSVTSIGDSTFYDCNSLTNITIPDSITSIGESAFSDCSSLTSIIIPESVTSIGICAFYGCSSLTSITIPDSVTSIGERAFFGCSGLTNINVDINNQYYDSRNNCNAIIEKSTNTLLYGCQNTIIPNSVTSIGDDAFYRCSNLTNITIPDSVTSIGISAFSDCSSLTSITIPGSVTSIGNSAFSSCESLTSITIPESVTSIEYGVFYKCSSLTTVNYRGTQEQWNAIRISSSNENLTNATINYNYIGE